MNEDMHFICSSPKWELLQQISKGNDSATTLAEKLSLSIPYVNNQLKLLEAAGYLQKEKQKHTKIGKPRTHYTITKELAIITAIKPTKTHQTLFKPQKNNVFIFNTLFLKNEEDMYYLQKFYYTNEELIFGTEMTAFLEKKEDSLHFLIVTENVEEFRKKYSNITIKNPAGKEQKIVIWSHTKTEILEGLQAQENYYQEKIKKANAFWEGSVKLQELQTVLEETK